jgi:hypothetical protein
MAGLMLSHDTELRFCQILTQDDTLGVAPLVVCQSIIIEADCSWVLHINYNHHVQPQKLSFLNVPPLLDFTSTSYLIQPL